jgi:hypothetical protein
MSAQPQPQQPKHRIQSVWNAGVGLYSAWGFLVFLVGVLVATIAGFWHIVLTQWPAWAEGLLIGAFIWGVVWLVLTQRSRIRLLAARLFGPKVQPSPVVPGGMTFVHQEGGDLRMQATGNVMIQRTGSPAPLVVPTSATVSGDVLHALAADIRAACDAAAAFIDVRSQEEQGIIPPFKTMAQIDFQPFWDAQQAHQRETRAEFCRDFEPTLIAVYQEARSLGFIDGTVDEELAMPEVMRGTTGSALIPRLRVLAVHIARKAGDPEGPTPDSG